MLTLKIIHEIFMLRNAKVQMSLEVLTNVNLEIYVGTCQNL